MPATLRWLLACAAGWPGIPGISSLRLAARLLVVERWFLRLRNNIRHASAGHKAKPAGAVGTSGDDGLGRRTIGRQFAAKAATRACNIHKKLLVWPVKTDA